LSLPTFSNVNDEFGFASANAFGVSVTQEALQYIQNENNTTIVGVGNGIQSTEIGTAVRLVCIEANKGWLVTSKLGVVSNYVGDTDVVALIAAIEATGVTLNSTQKLAIGNRIINAKSDGVWSKWVAYYGFVGGTAASHAINWKNPSSYLINWSGTVTHNASGSRSNGSTGYGDTGIDPSIALNISNCGLGFYMTAAKASEPTYEIAVNDGTTNLGLLLFNSIGYFETGLDATSDISNNRAKQYLSGNKISTSRKIYKNGALVNTEFRGEALPTGRTLYVLARNASGTAQSFSTGTYGSFCINTGLTDAEETANYISELAFQTALGRN
jgi:hypothetical protein